MNTTIQTLDLDFGIDFEDLIDMAYDLMRRFAMVTIPVLCHGQPVGTLDIRDVLNARAHRVESIVEGMDRPLFVYEICDVGARVSA